MPILRRRKGLGNAQGFFLIKKKGETSPKSGHFFGSNQLYRANRTLL